MMAEYIEREAVIHTVTSRKVQEMLRSDLTAELISGRNPSDWLNGFDVGMQQAINIIAAADVVEVVRCKDCKYYTTERDGRTVCTLQLLTMRGTDFCSYGARKDERK